MKEILQKTITLSVIEIGDGISIEYDGSKAKSDTFGK